MDEPFGYRDPPDVKRNFVETDTVDISGVEFRFTYIKEDGQCWVRWTCLECGEESRAALRNENKAITGMERAIAKHAVEAHRKFFE